MFRTVYKTAFVFCSQLPWELEPLVHATYLCFQDVLKQKFLNRSFIWCWRATAHAPNYGSDNSVHSSQFVLHGTLKVHGKTFNLPRSKQAVGFQIGIWKRQLFPWNLRVFFVIHLQNPIDSITHHWLPQTLQLTFDMLSLMAYLQRRQWHPTPALLPGKSHWQTSLVGCSPWGREESDMTERLDFHFSLSCIGEGNGNPLQCSCLENPRDGGA